MLLANSNPVGTIILIAIILIPILVIGIIVFFKIRNNIYTKFVKNNSNALSTLEQINKQYVFKKIKSFDMQHSYDNENFYDNISPMDYLTYQLVYKQKEVSKALRDTLANAELSDKYSQEIKERCRFGQFGDVGKLDNVKLINIEKALFEENIKTPSVEFDIEVLLMLTNINGGYITSKSSVFHAGTIKTIIKKINQKDGNFYTNREIWDALCRVERGKVTNKMRFAVMARDGYRCVKCGRPDSRVYLEIDHIIPIAKGGKSTYDNLQTLCHDCNVRKGADID